MKRSEFLRVGLLACIATALPVTQLVDLATPKEPQFYYRWYKVTTEFLNDKPAFENFIRTEKLKLNSMVDFKVGWIEDDILRNLFTVLIKFKK